MCIVLLYSTCVIGVAVLIYIDIYIYFTPRYYKECINVLILYTVPGYSACVGNDAAKIGGRRGGSAREGK